MAGSRTLLMKALIAILLQLLLLNENIDDTGVFAHVNQLTLNDDKESPKITWLFSNNNDKLRIPRDVVIEIPNDENENDKNNQAKYIIKNVKCQEIIKRLCGPIDNNNDDLFILECAQTFKPNEVSTIEHDCQHEIWKHMINLTDNETVEKLTKKNCGNEIDNLMCKVKNQEPGSYLACIIEKRENVKEQMCSEYIQRLEYVAFGDFKIYTPMVSDCQDDIDKFKCGRIQPHREISQGQMLACLQANVNELDIKCKKRIFKISEIQADNIKLDRQLYIECMQDHIKFCSNIHPGSGQGYKCLMQYKLDRSMSKKCQDQLDRREKLIASDYKVSKGLVKACKEDIKLYHCRRYVSDDKEIRLAQILLCLESASKNGTKLNVECQKEIFDHRKILLEDYRLSPEIVDGCARDIPKFCKGLEVGGLTIHCLMEHTKSRRIKSRITIECQRALEDLVKQTDAGEDWRVDPVLHESCQSVVDTSCKNIRGGNARVILCLMEKIGTDKMVESCETALLQIQYFVARDFKLDPQLYKACKSDAINYCHAKKSWSDDGLQMDPERGPLILPCLYRYFDYQKYNISLKPECHEQIRRVMRQRAISVDLQPEIEDACFKELSTSCYDKVAKGEEILCLQNNIDELNDKCKQAVSNLTEDQGEHVELNPLIMSTCQKVMEKHCDNVLKYNKDNGDMMECLIEHKNQLDSSFEYKCKAAIEHFQLISLKNYHFTYKFKEACQPYANRWCHKATTKSKVIECLSNIIQNDIIQDSSHRILKNCRQQLRAQLYQQRENINFDPILKVSCSQDIRKYCFNIEAGNSQILECLASHKNKLNDICHKNLFKVRKQEFQDSSTDYLLLNSCKSMIRQYCHDNDEEHDKIKALDCLKKYKDETMFDDKCKNIVIKRMIEQNTDYRFNPALQSSCSKDIANHCKEVLNIEPLDKELEGKVIRCLKIKFRESQLTSRCQKQITILLRQAALNYHLNPLLVAMCGQEIQTICSSHSGGAGAAAGADNSDNNNSDGDDDDDDNDPGRVEECLKIQLNNENPEMREECRVEVANLIEETRADIHVDPLLQKACAIDVAKYCSDVPQGSGRHIKCLQNSMNDNKKPLQPDCYKMLSTRIEMFNNVAKLHLPNTMQELYTTVNHSPARRFFMIVGLTMVGLFFIVGLFCGRITRRTIMMKNK